MALRDKRAVYRPFEYPQYFEVFKRARNTVWKPETVIMTKDIADYHSAPFVVQNALGRILKTFVPMELDIGDYWVDDVRLMYPKPEIAAVCHQFAAAEQTHAQGYAVPIEQLGLQDYEAFLTDPVMQQKKAFFNNKNLDPLIRIAMVSGMGEGMSLFGSFVPLIFIASDGMFPGLNQIISWSIKDEDTHCRFAAALFRQDAREQGGVSKQVEKAIYDMMDTALDIEFAATKQVFEAGDLPNLTKAQTDDYLFLLANERLELLGLEPIYSVNLEAYKTKMNFELEVYGMTSTDFFAQSEDGALYNAKLNQDYSVFDWKNIVRKKW